MLSCVAGGYSVYVTHNYRFRRGGPVRIRWGHYAGAVGVVDSAVFQRTVDYPDNHAAGYHVVLDDENMLRVRWEQVAKR